MFSNKTQADIERENQINAGRTFASVEEPVVHRPRRITINTNVDNKPQQNFNSNNKQGFQAKGHDAVLKAAQDRQARVTFTIGDKQYTGVIIARDRYTISAILDGDDTASIIYKHVISMFKVEKGDK